MKRRLFKLASLSLLVALVVGAGIYAFAGMGRSASIFRTYAGISSEGPSAPATNPRDSTAAIAEPTASTAYGLNLFDGDAAAAPKYMGEGEEARKAPALDGTDATRGGIIYQQPYQSPLTAGQVDDNAKYQEYLDYLGKYYGYMLPIDVSQRLFVRVLDGAQMPVAGARVQLFDGDRQVYDGQTMSDGRALFLPRTAGVDKAKELKAIISRGQTRAEATLKVGGAEQLVTLSGVADNTGAVGLDLVFLLDATGSMSDEIERIKETVGSIAQRIEQLPGSSAPRFGLVSFRDRGDDYVTRQWDFTSDIAQFSSNLANVQAGGGGDTPELVSEGLHEAINLQGWADNGSGRRLRLIVLVGDAPPHIDYPNDYSYPALLGEAVAKGIKIFPVGASNLDSEGEYVFRQFAQVTQGQFVFLTYANGVSGEPGVMTDKHVDDFTVQNLDNLIVGLVAGEVANLTGQKVDASTQSQPVPVVQSVAIPVKHWLDELGDLLDGNGAIYLGALMSMVLVVIYSTRREKVRVEAPAQAAEIYVPESQSEPKSGPVTAPLSYFRRAEEAEEGDLVAAHIQPNASEVELLVDVQPAAGQRTLPLR